MIKWGGLIALEGVPIPPDGGLSRAEFLRWRGGRAMQLAQALYGEVVEQLGAVRDTRLVERLVALYEQVSTLDEWESIRQALDLRWHHEMPGEKSAREALGHAIDAYRDLRETVDGPAAHRQMHQIGALVGGLYGCWYQWDEVERLWFYACGVGLAHSPWGLSIGATGSWICSICRADASACDHEQGVSYPVTVSREDDGICNVCSAKACGHVVGEVVSVPPSYICVKALIHEVTMTKNPVEPRARLTRISMNQQPPPPKSPRLRYRCLSCLALCDQM